LIFPENASAAVVWTLPPQCACFAGRSPLEWGFHPGVSFLWRKAPV